MLKIRLKKNKIQPHGMGTFGSQGKGYSGFKSNLLTTELQSGGWVLEKPPGSFHYWQPAHGWRLLPMAGKSR